MDPSHFRVFFSQCALDGSAVVLSFLDPDVDAGAAGTGLGRLVGDRVDGGVDVGCHLRLCLVCRAPVSLRRLDVRAASRPGTPAETGTDELTTREGRDLSKNDTAGFDAKGSFLMGLTLRGVILRQPKAPFAVLWAQAKYYN